MQPQSTEHSSINRSTSKGISKDDALPAQRRGAALLDPQFAELTSAVRTPAFLSDAEICAVHAAAAEHKAMHGDEVVDTPGKLYLQRDGLPASLVPLVRKIAALVTRVDEESWGVLADEEYADEGPLLARCVEYHEYWERGRRLCGTHMDAGSLFTADVLLCDSTSFEGGELLTSSVDGDGAMRMVPQTFERGDCVVFLSHKSHAVAPLRHGKRDVLVIEFWLECECTANHRCMGLPPCSAEDPAPADENEAVYCPVGSLGLTRHARWCAQQEFDQGFDHQTNCAIAEML